MTDTIYLHNNPIKKGDVLIALDSEFDLTEGHLYTAISNQGEYTFSRCVFVINDRGETIDYPVDSFIRHEGERHMTK